MSSLEKKFLIRSSGQILGPFVKDEVVQLIKNGHISIFDEVAEPFTFWWYLQDHKEFKEIIDSVDFKSRLTNFITQISSKVTTLSRTNKIEETITSSQSKTVTHTEKNVGKTLENNQKKKSFQEIEIQKIQSAQEIDFDIIDQPKNHLDKQATYGSQLENEQKTRARISFVIKTSWKIIIIFGLFVGGYIVYKEVISPLNDKKHVIKELDMYGLNFYKAGNYKAALSYFEKAYSQNVLDSKTKIFLSSIFLRENKLQKANLLRDEIDISSLNQNMDLLLLNGLISFVQEDYLDAEKQFQLALNNGDGSIALVNLALLKRHLGDYDKSQEYLVQLTEKGYERGIAFYLKALNLLSKNQFEEVIDYINNELFIGQTSSLTDEYQQEFYFILAYSYMKTQRFNDLVSIVNSLLNQDPLLYQDYKYSSFIPIHLVNWTALYDYCKQIFDVDSRNMFLNALYGFCYLKIQNFKEGTKYIKQARMQDPKNSLFTSLLAYSLMLQGETIPLVETLHSIKERVSLSLILESRFLEGQKDWGRALIAWKNLLRIDPKNLSGLAGVAISSYHLGNQSQGDIYRERALRKYPYFVRLLFVKNSHYKNSEK